ncbi:oxidoreductase [Pseudonocardia sp. TRM90224]|uniref:oxidoreductase n=1 Tax=Pseudonocardia sp. TRM90224 TaxID=2812678 RepID=UPI001E5758CB|nr:oxidoreductase [Pseudonocardia sp. TRM90224]
MIPITLGVLALVDGLFAGFRAATGRNARIRKDAYNRRAAWRGLGVGAAGAAAVGLLVAIGIAVAADPGQRYDELVSAGGRMLLVLLPFAAVVVLSLISYLLLPMRESTFVMVLALGPFTLVRPAVAAVAGIVAAVGSTDRLVWLVAAVATASVLMVEPAVHRRWYSEPV